MPHTNDALRRYCIRVAKRTKRHGNWRQIYVDYDGMCALCGETLSLEFHEPFGEDYGNGKLQARILLCFDCHAKEHGNDPHQKPEFRRNPSQLQEDITFEITRAGSMKKWMAQYGLKEKAAVLGR